MNSYLVIFSLISSLFLVGSFSYSFAAENSVDVVENKMVTLVGKGMDIDGNNLTYRWVQIDGEPVSLSSYTIPEPQFMAPEVANGEIKVLSFQLTVSDPDGASAIAPIEIVINPVNHDPIGSAGKDQVVYDTIDVITFVSSFVDPDGDSLTYTWKQKSGQLVELSNIHGRFLTLSPLHLDYSQSAPLTFELTVEDGFGGTASDTVNLYPISGLLENRLIKIQAGPMQIVHEGDLVTLSATGTTANGQPITYSWAQFIGTEVDLTSYTGPSVQFTAPQLPAEQEMMLSFQVSGYSPGNGWASALALVKVLPANAAPVADAGPDQIVSENVLVKLIGSGTDPDGDNLRYSWAQKSGMKVDFYEQTSFSVYFFSPKISTDSENLVFELTVTDSRGNTDTDTATITVKSVNLPPRVSAGPDMKVLGGSEVTITGTAFDPENQPLAHSWKQISGETVSFDSQNLSFSFKAPPLAPGESKRMIFQLTATDSANQSASDQVIIIVVPENSPPIVDAGSDITADENTIVSLMCTAFDPDGDVVSLSWSSSDSEVVFSTPKSGSTNAQLPYVLKDSVITMTCTGSDGKLSGSDSMKVNVKNTLNLPIIANAGPDMIVNENIKISLDGSKSNDPENQPLSYMWTQTSGQPVVLSSLSSVSPSFTSPTVANGEVKVLVFELKVYDNNGRESTDSVTITVDPVNTPPTATATATQS